MLRPFMLHPIHFCHHVCHVKWRHAFRSHPLRAVPLHPNTTHHMLCPMRTSDLSSNILMHWRRPFAAAQSGAVSPSLSIALTSALPVSNSIITQVGYPVSAAHITGVLRSELRTLGFAPASSRRRITPS